MISFINSVDNTTEHSVSIAPGTVPTGFYASQVSLNPTKRKQLLMRSYRKEHLV